MWQNQAAIDLSIQLYIVTKLKNELMTRWIDAKQKDMCCLLVNIVEYKV